MKRRASVAGFATATVAVVLAALLVAAQSAGAAGGSAPVAQHPGTFVPLRPARVLDTRTGAGTPVGANQSLTLTLAGAGGVPATGAGAVALNVAVTGATSSGYVTVYPYGHAKPGTSTVNFTRGATVANLTIAQLGSGGRVVLTNTSTGSVHLVADVTGYYVAGATGVPGAFTAPATTQRLLDTRYGTGAPRAPLAAHGSVQVQALGNAGVPASGVSAVALNVAVTGAPSAGYLTVYPAGATRPSASSLNFAAQQTVANLVVVPVGSGGAVTFYNAGTSTVQVIADVVGYFGSGSTQVTGSLLPLVPARVLDTRTGNGAPAAALPAHGTLSLTVAGRGGLPPHGAAAVLLNLAVTAPTAAGFLTAYSSDQTRPGTSSINFAAGQTIANLVVVPVGVDGTVRIYNAGIGSVQVIADVNGYDVGISGSPVGSCAGFTNSTGITDSTIDIGNASDLSGPVPGEHQDALDATKAFTAYFDSVSSICGRTLTVDSYDTQMSSTGDQQAATASCAADVALVGSDADADGGGAATTAGCGEPDVRALPNQRTRQDAVTTFASTYSDIEQVPAAVPSYLQSVNPTAASHAAILYVNALNWPTLASSELQGWQAAGFTFVYTAGIDITAFNYSTYVSAMVAHGVRYVQFVGPSQYLVRLQQAMAAQSFDPIVVSVRTAYDQSYVQSGGTDVDGTYAITDTALLEEAASNPEMQLYETWLHTVAPDAVPSAEGLRAWSAARLFADVATALGGKLSRATLLTALASVHSWTGDGLHGPVDVGARTTSPCAAVLQLQNGAWVRSSPGQFLCGALTTTT